MIPTYNPQADYLAETLLCVLKQDAGPEQMQIEVVDDGSMHDTASEAVRRVGAGRVAFHAGYGNGTVLASYGDSIDSLLDFDPNPDRKSVV